MSNKCQIQILYRKWHIFILCHFRNFQFENNRPARQWAGSGHRQRQAVFYPALAVSELTTPPLTAADASLPGAGRPPGQARLQRRGQGRPAPGTPPGHAGLQRGGGGVKVGWRLACRQVTAGRDGGSRGDRRGGRFSHGNRTTGPPERQKMPILTKHAAYYLIHF